MSISLLKNMSKIFFILPGATFSNNFLISFTRLFTYLLSQKHVCSISNATFYDIYQVRNLALGYNNKLPDNQKPVDGKDYDYLMLIDSDMVFTIDDFMMLLGDNKDVVSGIYKNSLRELTCGYYNRETGESTTLKEKDIEGNLIEVAWTGLGFMLIKKGVIESLGYPWFRPQMFRKNGFTKMIYEDLGFCLRLKKKGYNIYVDTKVKLGHEKKVVISF